MTRRAPLRLLVIALLVMLSAAVVGCPAPENSPDTPTTDDQQALQLPTVEAKNLAALATQMGIGDSFTIDANPLQGPIGEPALNGNLVMQVNSTDRDVKVDEDTVPKLGAAYGAGLLRGEQYVSKRGVYFIVNYSVTNDTDGLLKPGAHVNGGFTLADGTGREWEPMDFVTDHFDGSAAFALQLDLFDPREFVLQGERKTTILAFDIAEDASNLRLRSNILGLEIMLDQ